MTNTIGTGSPDRLATTLALLRVNHEHHVSYLGSYLPFVFHCLGELPDTSTPISARALAAMLKKEFGVQLPLGVVRSLLREAESHGKVRTERKLYFPVEDALSGCNLNQARQEFGRRFNFLAASLAQHARELHDVTWDLAKCKNSLIEYADGFSSDVLAAAIQGRNLPSRAPHDLGPDQFIVHEFVARAFAEMPDEFDFLVGLVKARMLADSLYLDIQQGQEEDLSRLAVYFDGPILLYLLGCAGEEIQAPYLELVEMLKAQGASLRCFHHSVVEAQGILDVAAERKSAALQGEQYHGDVVGYLVRSDRSRTDIELQAQNLVKDLAELGVVETDTPERIPELQPDEDELEAQIRAFIPNVKMPALQRDVDSLVGIHTMRRGRTPRHVSSSRAILVTHNYALFKASARFFKQRQDGRTVPHCVYDATFTALVWLHQPRKFPDLPREFVLADSAAALQPSDELWRRYNAATQALFEKGELDEDELRFLRYSDDARSLLMDITRGSPEAFTDGTVGELLELYRQRTIREVEESASAAQATLSSELERSRRSEAAEREKLLNTRVRVAQLSDSISRYVANALFGAAAVILVLGVVLGPVGPLDTGVPFPIQIVCATFAVAITLWSGIAGGTLRNLRDRTQSSIRDRLERVILRHLDLH